MLEYIFSVIAFTYIPDQYPDLACTDSMWRCLVVTLDQTFKNDGGISGALKAPYYSDWDSKECALDPECGEHELVRDHDSSIFGNAYTINYERLAFDNLFNLILVILVLQIVSGIIIDTFSSMREDAENVEEDAKNNCFICGKTRDEIEKIEARQGAFEKHTTNLHNPWSYIYFMLYLQQKPDLDYTATESYVNDKVSIQDNSWFPNYADTMTK